MDIDQAERIALAHVASVRLDDPDYRMGFECCGKLADGWLFAYRVQCLKPISEAEQACFAGAGGFTVSTRGVLSVLSVPEMIEAQRQLG